MNFPFDSKMYSTIIIRGQSLEDQWKKKNSLRIYFSGQIWNSDNYYKSKKAGQMKWKKRCLTFGSEANTCCLTSQTNRSDGNCKHLNTFNSGTWTRTKSHPSRGSGGGSSSKPPPPANIGAWSIILWAIFFFFSSPLLLLWSTVSPTKNCCKYVSKYNLVYLNILCCLLNIESVHHIHTKKETTTSSSSLCSILLFVSFV